MASPEKGKARNAMREVASRALLSLIARLIVDVIRDLADWLFS